MRNIFVADTAADIADKIAGNWYIAEEDIGAAAHTEKEEEPDIPGEDPDQAVDLA